MKNYIKSHSLDIILIIMVTIAIIFRGSTVTLSGGWSISVMMLTGIIGATMLYTGIFGGEVSVESKGLIPFLKGLRNKGK